MPKTEETWMDGITTAMMEHICDDLCKYPDQLSGEALEDNCAECKMGRFVCDILNQYNKVNDFVDSQCAKLMNQMHELKERDTANRSEEQKMLQIMQDAGNSVSIVARYSRGNCLRK